jgi:hypothetical protein
LVFAFFAIEVVIVIVAVVEARAEGEEDGERDDDDRGMEVAVGEPSHDGCAGGGVLEFQGIGVSELDQFGVRVSQHIEEEEDAGETAAFWNGGVVGMIGRGGTEEVVAFDDGDVVVLTFPGYFECGQFDAIEIGDAVGNKRRVAVGAEGVEVKG